MLHLWRDSGVGMPPLCDRLVLQDRGMGEGERGGVERSHSVTLGRLGWSEITQSLRVGWSSVTQSLWAGWG